MPTQTTSALSGIFREQYIEDEYFQYLINNSRFNNDWQAILNRVAADTALFGSAIMKLSYIDDISHYTPLEREIHDLETMGYRE